MKIGIVCYPSLGGSGILATELGHELARRGHEVHFITYERPFRFDTGLKNLFFHPVEMSHHESIRYPDYTLALAVKIAEVSDRVGLEVLHVHYAVPHAASAYMAKQLLATRLPVVITTLHGTDITLVGRDPAYFEVVKFSIEGSDGVTAVSESLKAQTIDYFEIASEIEVIPNFFVTKIQTKMRHAEKLIVHASNFRTLKRVEDVVHIFSQVRKKVACKLLLIGTGGTEQAIRELVHEKGLDAEVTFVGESQNIDAYLARADLFLLPSAQESFGLAALEAMAHGVPVIGTNVGGLPEVIVHNETGFLAPVGDIESMSRYAVDILTDAALAKRLGEAGQRRAETLFSADRIVPQYEAYYLRVLG